MSEEEIYKKRDQMFYEMHSDIKHLVRNFDSHVAEDQHSFEAIKKDIESINIRMAGWIGGGAVLMVVFQVLLKLW